MQNNRISCYLLALWKPARLHHQMKTMYLTVEVHCHNNPDPTSCTFRAEGWPTLKFPCPGLSSFLQVIPTSHMKTLWSATRRSCSSWLNRASNLCWFSIVLRVPELFRARYGGWENPLLVQMFEQYAGFVFSTLEILWTHSSRSVTYMSYMKCNFKMQSSLMQMFTMSIINVQR